MELREAIRSRRTIHHYQKGALPEGAIERAFEAAQWAPCHFQTWPWRFIRLGQRARIRFVEVAGGVLFKENNPRREEIIGEFKELAATISEVIFVTCVRDPRDRPNRENYAAVHAAIQNLLLSLTADGVATKWETNPVMHADAVYEFLGVDRGKEEIVAFILAGIAAHSEPAPERPPLADIVRFMES
jgi:nitroreductase